MTWKLYAVVSAGAFVATYLVSSPPPQTAPSPASPAAQSSQRDRGSEIEELANSLRVRRAGGTYQSPGRDPFTFRTRTPRPPAVVPPPVTAADSAPPPAPALPIVSLTGIASDVVKGKTERAAVLSMPAGVLIVREGESVAGLYTVLSIGEDSIDLQATADGSRRTLRLGR